MSAIVALSQLHCHSGIVTVALLKNYKPLRLFSLNCTKQPLSPIYPSCIFTKSLLSSEAEAFAQLAIENKEVLLAIRYYSIILKLGISH